MKIKKIVASSRNLRKYPELLLLHNNLNKLSSIIIQYINFKFKFAIKSWC